ncbi:DNA cross-link repair 1A protein [Brachionichthys hirsutus]|uniref:DNA cross-link repair 1A protein n=1 Tax=Brachionichthys hirsutus TaxID=412623 RepID=UPI003604BEF8
MSQKDDSENDIWEYKPLEKKRKRLESPTASKRRCTLGKNCKKDARFSVNSLDNKVKTDAGGQACCAAAHTEQAGSPLPSTLPTSHDKVKTDSDDEAPSGSFCPMCQMPFSILVVQTQSWHVAECLDTPRDTRKECPDGLRCSSTLPNHYKKFNHAALAVSRANGDTTLQSLSQQAGPSGTASPGCLRGRIDNEPDGSNFGDSQDGLPASSSCSTSPHAGTPPAKRTNGLLLLRSPGPEDFKKEKGWSSVRKKQKSSSSSQESRKELPSTPVRAESRERAREDVLKTEPSPQSDESISYSPLSEIPAETKVANSKIKKALFDNDTPDSEAEGSKLLFSDGFSSEDELIEVADNLETNNSLSTQLYSLASAPPTNQLSATAVAEDPTCDEGRSVCTISPCKSSIQSPQSTVLECLRETLQSPDRRSFNDCSIESEQCNTTSPRVPSSQTSTVGRSQTMPAQRGQSNTGRASCLKQTDIGVFFGLKPLKEKENETESGSSQLDTAATFGKSSRRLRQPRTERPMKGNVDATAGTSQGSAGNRDASDVEKGRTKAWRGRRRWNGANADGTELPRCPFYKKIPGTKFAVDAFQYGEIVAVTAYFLTHFHSDHYGGLTKNSTFPIYCNKITGNLVKSKLRVAEQYIHILPMNTRVTVEGVTVILLDANHCPGAAMLLFFLPDGQTVLHTGDFRADPSMETYPELLGCKVQTLYLDTTYCSPEYTFPKQQEAINFAASTAFELVTLNPRTLVVCGSYSVGKEKVFLALAEILRSKVCLSRDKFNTMCCLESEQIRRCVSTDWKAARVHVLPMMQLTFKKLQDHLTRFSSQYDRLVAFKPTGWTFSQQVESVQDIQPEISGNISIFGIPYSEHSSFLEMKRFVQWLQPLKIIPTVNNGSWDGRKAMEKCFSEWLMEAKAKR